jgi:hypothetical protein
VTRADVERHLADGLGGIGVEEHAVLPRDRLPISASGWIVPTSLLAAMTLTRIRVGRLAERTAGSDAPVAADGEHRDPAPLALEALAAVEDGPVLDGGRDDVAAARLVHRLPRRP